MRKPPPSETFTHLLRNQIGTGAMGPMSSLRVVSHFYVYHYLFDVRKDFLR